MLCNGNNIITSISLRDATGAGSGGERGALVGRLVLFRALLYLFFFRKKSTFLKALLIGRGGPVYFFCE